MIEKQIKTPNLSTTAHFPLKEQFALRIVFMGTPEFAVASLDKLVNAGCNIVGVVTAPDKAAGRGMQLQQSAVKKYAVEKDLHILQPEKLKNPEFLEALKNLQADLQIVVAFRMLPEVVWNMPPMGTVNLHGSLLPQYRGAAPINWAIINGEKTTGVTTFKLQHEIDTGDILLSATIEIGCDDNAGDLHDKMKEVGADLLLQTVKGLATGSLQEKPQMKLSEESDGELKHAPKIFTETCQVDWNKPVWQVQNLIRGLSPYPTAFSFLDGKKLKIYKSEKIDSTTAATPGTSETDKKTFLQFACSDGYISITELQLEGKKRMQIADFLRGYRWQE
jgi:methionyl-tRNA formyltransferase